MTDDVQLKHEANRQAWNEGARAYERQVADTVEFLREGGVSLHHLELELLGDLSSWCDTAVHLQCASGRDTLSLLNAGAHRVIGVDISDVHVGNAESTVAALGWTHRARFVRSDARAVPHELDGTADLVYTGQGALCWLHDLDAWAAVVARLLRPGGRFVVLDDHPALLLFDLNASTLTPSDLSYFGATATGQGWPDQYIGDIGIAVAEQAVKHERFWNLADVFGALTRAGLIVDHLGEHPDEFWPVMPNMPEETRRRLPLTFTMGARKP